MSLTNAELEALELSGRLANAIRDMIYAPDDNAGQTFDSSTAAHDWAEAAADIHRLQDRIAAQAAARDHPDDIRLQGHRFK